MIKKRLLSFLGAAAIAAALTFAVVSLSPSNGFTSGTIHSGLCYEATGVAPDAIVASVDGNGASADLIAYWTGYNVSYLDSYMQYYTGAAFDWDYTFEDGTSITDYVKSNVLMAVKQHLVLENLAEEYGATLTAEQKAAIEASDQAYIDQYGSEEAFEAELNKLGMRRETYDRVSTSNYLYQNLYQLYNTEGSKLYASDEDLALYAAEKNYITADHILLTTKDTTTGEALSDEEKAEKKALAEEIKQKLDACEGNNYAYAVGTPSGNAKYPCIKMSESPVEYEQTNDDDTYIETNRVQVSATNNLFSLPFANSYRFGVSEERIIAIATVVDELSATRFGAFPLYVFTDRGVWSLESGTGEVLYSNILPVNHDQIINPNTCTALETVFYITSRGVHNLRGRSSQLISRQIERYTGELTEYLKTAQICFQFKYGDLIVYNPEYPYAYVYSLASGFWSSRDMTGRILNNGQIIMRGAIALLGDETMSCSVDCRIVTRPLKFGTTDFKRLETAVVRIMSQDCFVHVIAEGSNDCRTWITLRDVWCRVGDMDARFRRTSTSFKFLRFKLHLTANERLSMTGVDVEWYPRFTKRLR